MTPDAEHGLEPSSGALDRAAAEAVRSADDLDERTKPWFAHGEPLTSVFVTPAVLAVTADEPDPDGRA